MHIYQKNILDKLRGAPTLRYSQLQPSEVESSHFKYHLDQLIKDGLVEQKTRGVYGMTVRGMSMVDRLSVDKANPRLAPKVITYSLLYDKNNYYLQRKSKQPYQGLVNMIGGKVHIGESTLDAARREVFEKTAYLSTDGSLKSIAEIRILQKDVLLSHAIAYVYSFDISEFRLSLPDCLQVPINEIEGHPDLAPDFLPIIKELKSAKGNPFISLNINYEPHV